MGNIDDPTINEFWNKFIDRPDFKNKIQEKGYYNSVEPYGKNLYKELGFTLSDEKLKSIKPQNDINKDFWHKQPESLTDNNFYVVRTGQGKFVIISKDHYGTCYLDLDDQKPDTELPLKPAEPPLVNLETLLSKLNNEKTIIPKMKYYGILSQITDELGLGRKYYGGPLGNNPTSIPIYLKKKNSTQYERIETKGQVETDFTIFCKDTLVLIELKNGKHPDLGWHKLAYAAMGFEKNRSNYKKIIPMYVFQDKNDLYIYAFEKFDFYKDGIELNNSDHMKPTKSFKTTLK